MTKLVVAAGIAGIIALAPYGVKTMSDNIINDRINELKLNGIKLEITNSKGYLESTRDYVLTIEDEIKFKNLIKQQMLSKYPVYENIIEGLFEKDSKEFDEFLRGIVFKGDIKNSNIDFGSDIQVNTYLHKFSDKIMSDIEKDEESKRIILPFLKKEGLSVNMTYSSEGKLKNLKLKDINEDIKTKNSYGTDVSSNLKVLGYEVVNKSTEDRLIADVALKDLILEVKDNDASKISLNGLDYTVNYKNEFENEGVLNFKGFNFTNNADGVTLGETSIEAKGETFTNSYSSSGTIKTTKLHANTPKGDVDLDSLFINVNVDNLDFENLKKLNTSYMKLQSLSIEPNRNQRKESLEKVVEPMLESLNKLINDGFLVDLKIDLNNFTNTNLKLQSILIDANAALNKNDLNIKFLNNQAILQQIDATINISMNKVDMESIVSLIPPQMAMMLSIYAKEENGKVLFDIELDKGKILVNGKNLN